MSPPTTATPIIDIRRPMHAPIKDLILSPSDKVEIRVRPKIANQKYSVGPNISEILANGGANNAKQITPIIHPLLMLLASQVSVADAGIRQSEINAKGNPQLTIGTRRERPDQFQPYIDSVGISLNIPIGGKSIVAARTSAARMQKTDAEVALLNAERLLERDIHEAEHGLFVTREALPLTRQRFALASENSKLARTAFEAGELNLIQVIGVLQQEIEAERELRMLELQEQRQITLYNHLIGVMP